MIKCVALYVFVLVDCDVIVCIDDIDMLSSLVLLCCCVVVCAVSIGVTAQLALWLIVDVVVDAVIDVVALFCAVMVDLTAFAVYSDASCTSHHNDQ